MPRCRPSVLCNKVIFFSVRKGATSSKALAVEILHFGASLLKTSSPNYIKFVIKKYMVNSSNLSMKIPASSSIFAFIPRISEIR